MARKRYKPEEIVAKLRQVDVLVSQGQPMADAIRQIGVSEVTYYRWRQEFGGLKTEQVKRENSRLRKAVSDLTLDKLILQEAPGETSKPRARRREPLDRSRLAAELRVRRRTASSRTAWIDAAPDRYRRGSRHLPRRFREAATSSCSSIRPRWTRLAGKIRQRRFFLLRRGGADVFVLEARIRSSGA